MHHERKALVFEMIAACGASYTRSGEELRTGEAAILLDEGATLRASILAILDVCGTPAAKVEQVAQRLYEYANACNLAGAATARYARTRSVTDDKARMDHTDAAVAARLAITTFLSEE